MRYKKRTEGVLKSCEFEHDMLVIAAMVLPDSRGGKNWASGTKEIGRAALVALPWVRCFDCRTTTYLPSHVPINTLFG